MHQKMLGWFMDVVKKKKGLCVHFSRGCNVQLICLSRVVRKKKVTNKEDRHMKKQSQRTEHPLRRTALPSQKRKTGPRPKPQLA
jgi:hypothetical protein